MSDRYRLRPGALADLTATVAAGRARTDAAADRLLDTIGRLNALTGGRRPKPEAQP